jgi:hypothetical protein
VVNRVEGRPVDELALRPMACELVLGILAGFALHSACVLKVVVDRHRRVVREALRSR